MAARTTGARVKSSARAESKANAAALAVNDLEAHVMRLALLNQALWELLREKLQLTDADLERVAVEIDLRDGLQDGKISSTPVKCPSCGRTVNSKHSRCMYCCQEFEKSAFG